MKKEKMIVLVGLFIALSVIGGYIKIPNPITSSIAFDSLPAFLAALVIGGVPGALVGFLGHMVSAAIGGFPMSLPIHLLVGFEMALIMLVFSFIAKRVNLISALVVGIILNGFGAPAPFILIPGMGFPFFLGSLLPLTAASILNVSLAGLIYNSIKNSRIVRELQGASNGI